MPKKKSKKKSEAKGSEKHGTRAYQKDTGGPSWDAKHEKSPDTEEMMALIERRPEDLELYREFLVLFADDPEMKGLSMTEMIDMAEMTMLQEKIMRWLLAVDSPDRLEEMRESNKMWRSIIQIKNKMMSEARERKPLGGDFEGLSKVLDQVDSDESASFSDSEESNQEVEEVEEDDMESESS